MLKQYYQNESGIQFQQLPGPNQSSRNKSGVHFQFPPEQNLSYQIPIPHYPMTQQQQPTFIDMNQVFGQRITVDTPKTQENGTLSKQTPKKHNRGASNEHRSKNRRVRYNTVEYERLATGTSKLIFGSMFCWGMNAITAYYFAVSTTDSIMFGINAVWLWFAAMATAFYVAGGFMHHVKRTAAAYCCWISAFVPVMLGCYCVVIYQEYSDKIHAGKAMIDLESLLLCLWFAYLTVLYISMGTVFYRYRSEGFTKIYI